jgi:oligopeptide/dipeptide ABC transporter ATP-binding protein
MTLLELDNLAVTYPGRRGGSPVPAVVGVSLALARGQVIGIAGESGCGKSTLARAAVGLLTPTSGAARFDGQAVRPVEQGRRSAQQARLQMVFQDPYSSLNPRRRIGDQIADGLVNTNLLPASERGARVAELLVQVGLPADAAPRLPNQFSGGQRQRIAIARALAVEPSAIILDEPFASLDASSQAQIINLLLELRRSENIGMLLISHDLGVVRHVSDVVAVMYLGRVVEVAQTADLWREPLHPYTQALISAVPSVSAAGTLPATLSGEVPDPAHPPTGCPFHPRCTFAFDLCTTAEPPLAAVAPGREVACWLHESPETDPPVRVDDVPSDGEAAPAADAEPDESLGELG